MNWTALFSEDMVQDTIAKSYLEQLFPILYDAGKYVILVIDEFGKAGNVFGLQEQNFGWFRSLLQSNDRGLSMVTISRRSIRFIEQNCFGGSTFDGIFSKRGLFGYSNSEIDAYYALLEEHGLTLTQEQRKDITYSRFSLDGPNRARCTFSSSSFIRSSFLRSSSFSCFSAAFSSRSCEKTAASAWADRGQSGEAVQPVYVRSGNPAWRETPTVSGAHTG